MDTFQALRSFIRVVELGSFTAAAHEIGTAQPTISKTVARLERELGARLIERSTTGLTLTDEGRRFYERARRLMEEYVEALDDVRGHTGRPVGALVVAAPVGLSELRLNRLAMEFLAGYPEIELELVVNDRIVDLLEEGVDLAIRLSAELPPNVIARKLGSSPRLLVAARTYMKSAPPLLRPEDLKQHAYLRFGGIAPLAQLTFVSADETIVVHPSGRYRINSSLALRECFRAGAGVGTAPAWLVQDLIDDGELVQLLPDWTLPSQPLYLVYPSRRYLPQRTRSFMAFLTDRLLGLPGFVGVDPYKQSPPHAAQ